MRQLGDCELVEFDARVRAQATGVEHTWLRISWVIGSEDGPLGETITELQTDATIAYRFGIKVSDMRRLREQRGVKLL